MKKSKLQLQMQEAGITQADVARAAGVSDVTVSDVVRGIKVSTKVLKVTYKLIEQAELLSKSA